MSVEGNRILLTGFQPWRGWGCWEHSGSEPPSPTRPRAFLASQEATSQNHAQKFPVSLICPSVSPAKRSPTSLECTLVGFRVAILSQQLSPSGSGECCSQPPCSGPGKHVPCYTGSRCSPGRHTSHESDFSVCPRVSFPDCQTSLRKLLPHSSPCGWPPLF